MIRSHQFAKLVALALAVLVSFVGGESTCSLDTNDLEREDPNLHVMEYDVGEGVQTTKVYIEPDVTTFYRNSELPSSQKVTPQFNGLQGKFVNLSNETVVFSWEEKPGGKRYVMRHLYPWESTGTATFPAHRFVLTPVDDEDKILERFIVKEYPHNIYAYDPFQIKDNPTPPASLSPLDKEKYTGWRQTMLFHEQYLAKTGRSYLANYLRAPPRHFMWPAEYFGQEHWVTTKETHFTEIPPQEKLQTIRTYGKARILRDDEPRLLAEYRDPTRTELNLTLRVLSVAPRVLEIPHFLSAPEVQHILELAHRLDMGLSSTGDEVSGRRRETEQLKTRTSYNTWVKREETPIIDAIYRRAADLQRIDEALLRHRDPDERPEFASTNPQAEQLQLVHYAETQEYTAHHDFGFAKMEDKDQAARFSTLLLYLNEPQEGGETSFPRWSNAETFHELAVKPEIGKAVLFYSQLPDGNMDDLSQHAAKPVVLGEKYLINLWTWDPRYD